MSRRSAFPDTRSLLSAYLNTFLSITDRLYFGKGPKPTCCEKSLNITEIASPPMGSLGSQHGFQIESTPRGQRITLPIKFKLQLVCEPTANQKWCLGFYNVSVTKSRWQILVTVWNDESDRLIRRPEALEEGKVKNYVYFRVVTKPCPEQRQEFVVDWEVTYVAELKTKSQVTAADLRLQLDVPVHDPVLGGGRTLSLKISDIDPDEGTATAQWSFEQ